MELIAAPAKFGTIVEYSLLRVVIHFSYFAFCEHFYETHHKIRNTHYTLFSCEFRVLLMPRKNKPQNPLTFRTNADPGEKCGKQKKVCET